MSTWLSIATWWACTIVTIVGLALSLLVWWKKGARSGLRGMAWSLLPVALYLIHAVALVGHIGSAVVQFATALIFSTESWFGVILLGISVMFFLISGGIPMLTGRRHKPPKDGQFVDVSRMGRATGSAGPQATSPRAGDDLGDVQDILRRHGIK